MVCGTEFKYSQQKLISKLFVRHSSGVRSRNGRKILRLSYNTEGRNDWLQ